MVSRSPGVRLCRALILAVGLTLAACAVPSEPTPAGAGSPASVSGAGSVVPASTGESLIQIPEGTVADTTVPPLASCTAAGVPTVSPGVLTIATGSPAEPPWFVGNDPANGRGLEAAVAYEIADGLGFPSGRVRWVRVDRAQAAAGETTQFDMDLDQFTAPDPGTTTADYSTGYYSVTDSLLVPAAEAEPVTIAEVDKLTVGTAPGAGSTAYGMSIGPRGRFNSNQAAIAALVSRAIGGVVMPTPAALAAAKQNSELVVAGQLPSDPSAQPDQFKALLPKDSGLTGCVSATIDRLRAEGTLDSLAQTWIGPSAPALR